MPWKGCFLHCRRGNGTEGFENIIPMMTTRSEVEGGDGVAATADSLALWWIPMSSRSASCSARCAPPFGLGRTMMLVLLATAHTRTAFTASRNPAPQNTAPPAAAKSMGTLLSVYKKEYCSWIWWRSDSKAKHKHQTSPCFVLGINFPSFQIFRPRSLCACARPRD